MRNYLVLKFTIEVQTCAFPKWICTFLSWILFHSLENSIRFSFFGSKEQIAVVTVTHAINICYLFSVDNMSNWQWYKQKLHDARAKSGPCKTKTQHTRNDKAEEKAEAKHVEAIWCVSEQEPNQKYYVEFLATCAVARTLFVHLWLFHYYLCILSATVILIIIIIPIRIH